MQQTNSLGTTYKERPMARRSPVDKVRKVMREYKEGALHSGSKKGPKVSSRKQAIAIALSEQRKQAKGGY